MSKRSPRIRTKGAYEITSAESLPRAIKVTPAPNGRAPVVTPADKMLAAAVLRHHRSI